MKYNQKLHALVQSSALCECVVPVFVCDSDLTVCLTSQGAKNVFRSLFVGKSLEGLFSKEARQKILALDDGAMLTTLARKSIDVSVIVIGGRFEGEPYRIIIAEPQIFFSDVNTPWYINDSFTAVCNEARRLLCEKKSDVKRLEWYCATLSRLCSFTKKPHSDQLYSMTHSGAIYTELDTVIYECSDILKSVGGTSIYHKYLGTPFVTSVEPRHIFLCTTTLLAALILLSADGVVTIDCCDGTLDSDYMEISLGITPDTDSYGEFDGIDALLAALPHLRLELAAVKDMASRQKISLDAACHEGTLTVYCRIPSVTDGKVKFRTPGNTPREEIRAHMRTLFEWVKCEKKHGAI